MYLFIGLHHVYRGTQHLPALHCGTGDWQLWHVGSRDQTWAPALELEVSATGPPGGPGRHLSSGIISKARRWKARDDRL